MADQKSASVKSWSRPRAASRDEKIDVKESDASLTGFEQVIDKNGELLRLSDSQCLALVLFLRELYDEFRPTFTAGADTTSAAAEESQCRYAYAAAHSDPAAGNGVHKAKVHTGASTLRAGTGSGTDMKEQFEHELLKDGVAPAVVNKASTVDLINRMASTNPGAKAGILRQLAVATAKSLPAYFQRLIAHLVRPAPAAESNELQAGFIVNANPDCAFEVALKDRYGTNMQTVTRTTMVDNNLVPALVSLTGSYKTSDPIAFSSEDRNRIPMAWMSANAQTKSNGPSAAALRPIVAFDMKPGVGADDVVLQLLTDLLSKRTEAWCRAWTSSSRLQAYVAAKKDDLEWLWNAVGWIHESKGEPVAVPRILGVNFCFEPPSAADRLRLLNTGLLTVVLPRIRTGAGIQTAHRSVWYLQTLRMLLPYQTADWEHAAAASKFAVDQTQLLESKPTFLAIGVSGISFHMEVARNSCPDNTSQSELQQVSTGSGPAMTAAKTYSALSRAECILVTILSDTLTGALLKRECAAHNINISASIPDFAGSNPDWSTSYHTNGTGMMASTDRTLDFNAVTKSQLSALKASVDSIETQRKLQSVRVVYLDRFFFMNEKLRAVVQPLLKSLSGRAAFRVLECGCHSGDIKQFEVVRSDVNVATFGPTFFLRHSLFNKTSELVFNSVQPPQSGPSSTPTAKSAPKSYVPVPGCNGTCDNKTQSAAMNGSGCASCAGLVNGTVNGSAAVGVAKSSADLLAIAGVTTGAEAKASDVYMHGEGVYMNERRFCEQLIERLTKNESYQRAFIACMIELGNRVCTSNGRQWAILTLHHIGAVAVDMLTNQLWICRVPVMPTGVRIYPTLVGDVFRGALCAYLSKPNVDADSQLLLHATEFAVKIATQKATVFSPAVFYHQLRHPHAKRVAVIGTGVIGLSTAFKLQCAGHLVEMFSKDEHAVSKEENGAQPVTSNAAGAFWLPFLLKCKAQMETNMRWARESYEFWERFVAETGSTAVRLGPIRINEVTLQQLRESVEVGGGWLTESLEKFLVERAKLAEGKDSVTGKPFVTLQTYIIDPWPLMKTLRELVRSKGVVFHNRAFVDSKALHQFVDEYSRFGGIVVNCTGPGAGSLASDPACYLTRGDLLSIDHQFPTPSGDAQVSLYEALADEIAYITQHHKRLVVGGTAIDVKESEYHASFIDSASTRDQLAKMREKILANCEKRLPAAANALIKKTIALATSKVVHTVGFRPNRRDGPRVSRDADRTNLYHSYGHSGSGFTLCWGCASEIENLITLAPLYPLSVGDSQFAAAAAADRAKSCAPAQKS